MCMQRVPPVLLDVTARHLRGPTRDCALQTTRCRLTEARAGLRGSVLPSKGASACEDCNRATCLHLRRERDRQRDGETDRQRCRGTEHWTRQQSFLLVEAQVLAEHLRLWDRKFSSTNKQRPLYLESFGGPALRLGPGVPHSCSGTELLRSEVLERTREHNSCLFPPVDISVSLFKMHTFGYIKPNYRKLPPFS